MLSKGRTCTLPEMPGFRHVHELSTWHQVDTGWTWTEAMDARKCRGPLTDVIFHSGPFIHMMNVRQPGWAPDPTETSSPGRSALHPTARSALGLGAGSPHSDGLPAPLHLERHRGTLSRVSWASSEYLTSPVLTLPTPCPRTLATISPPHKSRSRINCLSINLFQVWAQTVSQGESLSPRGLGAKSPFVWE